MNAYLLAAGNGMRLKPMTDQFQKCLLPVGGKPMLEWWLDAVFKSGRFKKVYVNIHHMADEVERWLYHYEARTGNRTIYVIDERTNLLGTAGTLREHAHRDDDFMVAYTDTFSNAVLSDLGKYVDTWQGQRDDCEVGLISFTQPEDGSASTIALDAMGRVQSFQEKKNGAEKNVSWMGTLFARPEMLARITGQDEDLAHDVLSKLGPEQMRVIAHVDAYDIGRGIEAYERFATKPA